MTILELRSNNDNPPNPNAETGGFYGLLIVLRRQASVCLHTRALALVDGGGLPPLPFWELLLHCRLAVVENLPLPPTSQAFLSISFEKLPGFPFLRLHGSHVISFLVVPYFVLS